MKVIIINGAGGAGKDEFIKQFREAVIERSKGKAVVESISTVDYVKESAKFLGWNGVKNQKSRRFLSDLKDALTAFNDAPFKDVCERAKVADETSSAIGLDCFLFIHCREPEEIDRLVEKFFLSYSAESLLIRRPSSDPDSFDNHADRNILDYLEYAYIVDNDGDLDDLRGKAEEYLDYLESEKKVASMSTPFAEAFCDPLFTKQLRRFVLDVVEREREDDLK